MLPGVNSPAPGTGTHDTEDTHPLLRCQDGPQTRLPVQRQVSQPPVDASPGGPVRPVPWQLLLTHQARLRRLAVSCGCPVDDVADVVHEALLRAAAHPHLDVAAAGGLLTVTVRHLVVDLHRAQLRQHTLAEDHRLLPRPAPGPEEEVCDRGQAVWLHTQLAGLTRRERQVMHAAAGGSTPAQTARRLNVTVKAVELALSRARRRLLALAAAAAVLAVVVGGLTAASPSHRTRPAAAGRTTATSRCSCRAAPVKSWTS